MRETVKRTRTRAKTDTVYSLLMELGVDARKVYPQRTSVGKERGHHLYKARGNRPKNQRLLDRSQADLYEILELARTAWREQVKRMHPDHPGGTHEQAVRINAVWTRVCFLFARRGIVLGG